MKPGEIDYESLDCNRWPEVVVDMLVCEQAPCASCLALIARGTLIFLYPVKDEMRSGTAFCCCEKCMRNDMAERFKVYAAREEQRSKDKNEAP